MMDPVAGTQVPEPAEEVPNSESVHVSSDDKLEVDDFGAAFSLPVETGVDPGK